MHVSPFFTLHCAPVIDMDLTLHPGHPSQGSPGYRLSAKSADTPWAWARYERPPRTDQHRCIAALIAVLYVPSSLLPSSSALPQPRSQKTAMPTLLVRPPAASLAEGQITHIAAPASVSYAQAQAQWAAYTRVYAERGWALVEVPRDDACPDSVFVEDAVVVFGSTAVLASPGAETRRAEVGPVEAAVRARVPALALARIAPPGTLDGGDVLKVGTTVYVGRSSRTNDEGIAQLADIVSKLGYHVRPVPVTKALHLSESRRRSRVRRTPDAGRRTTWLTAESAVTALPDGTVIGYAPLVDDPALFPSFLPVPEAEGVAVVVLGPNDVLMSASAPKTRALLEQRGLNVTTAEITEFEKLEGCVTCLSVRVRDEAVQTVG